ncbi:MAG: hypothetical protein J2P28_14030 [Actinobacteria bacterium]|nr:hypothetical protein [Actinomycetota bacterium]
MIRIAAIAAGMREDAPAQSEPHGLRLLQILDPLVPDRDAVVRCQLVAGATTSRPSAPVITDLFPRWRTWR